MLTPNRRQITFFFTSTWAAMMPTNLKSPKSSLRGLTAGLPIRVQVKQPTSHTSTHRVNKHLVKIDGDYWRKKASDKARKRRVVIQRQRTWVQMSTASEETVEYTYPSLREVINSMLEGIATHNNASYSDYLKGQANLADKLKSLLRAEALEVFEGSDYSLQRLLSIGGTPPEGNGIYLHILWCENEGSIYLYVGQSTKVRARIREHLDHKYRKQHPSLHYYAWDQLGSNVKSAWVILSAITADSANDLLLLNLIEMWCAVTLQTLPTHILGRYIPLVKLSPRAGCHLNIASPLLQGFSFSRDDWNDMGQSNHLFALELLAARREQYVELRHSDDPILRNYWWDANQRARDTQEAIRFKNTRAKALNGGEVVISLSGKSESQSFYLGVCSIRVPKNIVVIDTNYPTYAQCALTNEPTQDCYAEAAKEHQDASKLRIRLRGMGQDGKEFDKVVRAGGLATVGKANTLYDLLIGDSRANSRAKKNRYTILGSGSAGTRTTAYSG